MNRYAMLIFNTRGAAPLTPPSPGGRGANIRLLPRAKRVTCAFILSRSTRSLRSLRSTLTLERRTEKN